MKTDIRPSYTTNTLSSSPLPLCTAGYSLSIHPSFAYFFQNSFFLYTRSFPPRILDTGPIPAHTHTQRFHHPENSFVHLVGFFNLLVPPSLCNFVHIIILSRSAFHLDAAFYSLLVNPCPLPSEQAKIHASIIIRIGGSAAGHRHCRVISGLQVKTLFSLSLPIGSRV